MISGSIASDICYFRKLRLIGIRYNLSFDEQLCYLAGLDRGRVAKVEAHLIFFAIIPEARKGSERSGFWLRLGLCLDLAALFGLHTFTVFSVCISHCDITVVNTSVLVSKRFRLF